jgi:hypothetical protein
LSAGQVGPTKYELFTKRVDPSRVAAARAIKQIDSSKLLGALEQAQRCTYIYVQIWARQAIANVRNGSNNPPADQPGKYKTQPKFKM